MRIKKLRLLHHRTSRLALGSHAGARLIPLGLGLCATQWIMVAEESSAARLGEMLPAIPVIWVHALHS